MIWTTSTISSTGFSCSRDVSTRPHLLVGDVVIRFDIQSLRCLGFRFSYPGSTFAHHRLQNCASSVTDLQSTNHRLASNFSDFTNSFSNSFDSSSRFVRLENHADCGSILQDVHHQASFTMFSIICCCCCCYCCNHL